jgi:hypothetical protein
LFGSQSAVLRPSIEGIGHGYHVAVSKLSLQVAAGRGRRIPQYRF